MDSRKRRITIELQGEYLEGMENLSRKNFRQLREQIMAILQKEMLEKGVLNVENSNNGKEVVA